MDLPRSTVATIMKESLPENTRISNEAKDLVQAMAVGMWIGGSVDGWMDARASPSLSLLVLPHGLHFWMSPPWEGTWRTLLRRF